MTNGEGFHGYLGKHALYVQLVYNPNYL